MSLTPPTAFVFPGQGSQVVGMGADVAAAYPVARAVFDEADDVLGFKLSALCFEGPEAALNDTLNTQPGLYVCSLAILRALQTERPDLLAVCAAGHSLGEFSALTAAGALNFTDGVRLVRERARLMQAAGVLQPGTMAALLGIDATQAQELCAHARAQTAGVLVVANDNCPGQVVISGDSATLDEALDMAKAFGVKRAVKLAVSVAAHSPLMAVNADAFAHEIAQTPFAAPQYPVYGNVSAAPLLTPDDIRIELAQQLTQNVRWAESVQAMLAVGITRFIEIGSKDVLTGLLKRIDRTATGIALDSAAALSAFLQHPTPP
ncbi:MAG: ACP S-malonyltransferase [Armatimonadetes bacterium]|nr:ACP S-malonyltransferase [Anaerolineae bacterium]